MAPRDIVQPVLFLSSSDPKTPVPEGVYGSLSLIEDDTPDGVLQDLHAKFLPQATPMQFVAACVLLREYRLDPEASDYATAQEHGLELHLEPEGLVSCRIEADGILKVPIRFTLCESSKTPGRNVWAIGKARFGPVAEFNSLLECRNFTAWLAEEFRDVCIETATLLARG